MSSLVNALLDYTIRSGVIFFAAGWSSLEAREAHNLKVAGSNPAPATENFSPYRLIRTDVLLSSLTDIVIELS